MLPFVLLVMFVLEALHPGSSKVASAVDVGVAAIIWALIWDVAFFLTRRR